MYCDYLPEDGNILLLQHHNTEIYVVIVVIVGYISSYIGIWNEVLVVLFGYKLHTFSECGLDSIFIN